jgi:hypothetical protein
MKLRTFALAAALSAAFALPASAGCCGSVGSDGDTRIIWDGTDGSISLWKTDPSLNVLLTQNYGPFPGWRHISSSIIGTNYYILWVNDNGQASIWLLGLDLNVVSSAVYGPEAGWLPQGLSVDGQGNLRLFWHTSEGQALAWVINQALDVVGNHNLGGPYFGWVF